MKVYLKYVVIIAFMLMTESIFAQEPPPPPDGGEVDDVSINFLIYPFLVLGAYLGLAFRNRFSK